MYAHCIRFIAQDAKLYPQYTTCNTMYNDAFWYIQMEENIFIIGTDDN